MNDDWIELPEGRFVNLSRIVVVAEKGVPDEEHPYYASPNYTESDDLVSLTKAEYELIVDRIRKRMMGL